MYQVQIGEDVYVGEAMEVVRFMMRADGAPAGDVQSYMEGIAARVAKALEIDGLDLEDAEGFLESLATSGVIPVQVLSEPSEKRTDPQDYIGDHIVTLAEDVDPEDVDID